MKKYFYLFLCASLLFSCTEKVKTCKISSYSVGSSLRTYQYNGDQLESFSDWSNNGDLLSGYTHFTYSDEKIQIDIYDAQGQFDLRIDALFNNDGKIGSVSTIYDSNNDGYPEDLYAFATMSYVSDKLDSMGIILYQSATTISYKYHWIGDNLASFQIFYDGVLGITAAMTYDDTPNPYYSRQAEMTALYNSNYAYVLSKNNVTHFLMYDEILMNYAADDTYINTVDADGNLNFNGIYHFSYECEEK